MNEVEFKQGPLLAGWAIAAGAGLVALGVAIVVGGFELTPAVAIAGVLFLIVGVILGLPRAEAAGVPAPMAAEHHAEVFASPAPLTAAPAAAPFMASAPAPLMTGSASAPQRPAAMAAARNGIADDLKQIKGVGPVLEKLLHSLGYFHFDQIAAWTAAEIAWVDENLEGFKGRVTRDEWVPQAKILASGGTTEHATQVANGEIAG